MSDNKIVEIIKDAFEMEKKEQYKSAIELLYQGLNIEPESSEILAQIASLYLKLKNYEIAGEYAQKAMATVEGSCFAQNILLKVCIETSDKNKFDECIKNLDLTCITQEILNTVFEGFIKFNAYQQAIILSEKLLNKEDFDAKTLYYFALCNYFSKNYDEAQKYAVLSKQKNSSDKENDILIADIAYKKGEYQKVYDILSKIEQNDMPAHAFYLLGLIYLNNKQYDASANCFSQACEKDGKNKDYLFNLANSYYFMGWFDEALKSLVKAKSLAPDDVEILYLNAEIYFWQNKFENALQLISSIIEKCPDNINAKLLKINIYLKKGLYELARCDLNAILAADAENIDALKLYFKVCLELGMKESALTTIEKILLLEPQNIDYICKLTELFCDLDKWDDAKISLQKLFEFSKEYEFAYELTIKIYFHLKDYEKTSMYAQKWLKFNPNAHYAHYILAKVYLPFSCEKAIKEITAALTLEPKEAEYYIFAGQIYENKGDLSFAYQYYSEAFDILKNKSMALKLLNIAISQNDADLVEKTYNRVRKIAPYDLDITFLYANFLYEIAETKHAVKILKYLKNGLSDKDLKAIVKSKIKELK